MDTKDMQRWTSVAAGTLLVAAGVKRGGRNGLLLSLAGGALAAFAFLRRTSPRSVIAAPKKSGRRWQPPHDRLMDDAKAFGGAVRNSKDAVHEASDESFPASDPPSFTSTTSVGKRERR